MILYDVKRGAKRNGFLMVHKIRTSAQGTDLVQKWETVGNYE